MEMRERSTYRRPSSFLQKQHNSRGKKMCVVLWRCYRCWGVSARICSSIDKVTLSAVWGTQHTTPAVNVEKMIISSSNVVLLLIAEENLREKYHHYSRMSNKLFSPSCSCCVFSSLGNIVVVVCLTTRSAHKNAKDRQQSAIFCDIFSFAMICQVHQRTIAENETLR